MAAVQPAQIASDDDLIEALKLCDGNITKAAQALGMNRRTVQRRIPLLAKRGYSPKHGLTKVIPDGYMAKGISSYYDKDGILRQQWVKSQVDPERMREMIDAAMAAMVKDLPRLPRVAATRKAYNLDVMACYPIGDPHIGMRAWAEECGQDWDLSIAERVHCGVMADLVSRAPDSEEATIVNLGDLFHYDSMDAVTPRSGHLLDADGRYAKMVDVGIMVLRQCIESALTKHKRVRVINAPGNHDPTGAIWLARALRERYHNNPRVIVDTKPALFTYFEFGKTLVGVHHGHTCKAKDLPGVMANDQAEAWGRTKHRYWWTGHVHHESVKEFPGCSVETFNTNAPADAYATAGGWRSREQSKCVVLHRELGEVARLTSHPAMLPAA